MHPRTPRATRALVALALATGALLVPATAAHADVTQGITGTLTGSGVGALSGVVYVVPVDPTVEIHNPDGLETHPCEVLCAAWSTDENGHFTAALPTGDYWLYFQGGPDSTWAPEWSGDAATRETATTVTVTAGTLTPADAELTQGGSISGTVAQTVQSSSTSADGLIEAWIPDSTFPGGYHRQNIALTHADGSYTITNLPTASYRLHFVNRNTRLEGWWQGQTSAATATPVAVDAPDVTPGISPTLDPWGTIIGRITKAADGTGAPGVTVDLFALDQYGAWNQVPWSTYSDPDGGYTLAAPAGTYRVRYYGGGSYKSEFWNNSTTLDSAQSLPVTTDHATPDVDVALEPTEMVNTSVPTTSGYHRVGHVLTAASGGWYPSGATYTYQWLRGSTKVAGATKKTYALTPSDVGKRIQVLVTAKKAGFLSTFAVSHVTVPISRAYLAITSAPKITGTTHVGRWLLAVPQKSSPAATSTSYEWLRNGRAIHGKESHRVRYHLTAADRGQKISVRVTVRRTGYKPAARVAQRSHAVG